MPEAHLFSRPVKLILSVAAVVGGLTTIGGGLTWLMTLDARADGYINGKVKPALSQLEAKVAAGTVVDLQQTQELQAVKEGLSGVQTTLETLIRRSTAEVTQSRGESDALNKLLCIVEAQAAGTPIDNCE